MGGALKHLVDALRCSLAGFRRGFETQAALRQELLVLVVAVPAALLLRENAVERALLIGSWMLVIVVEILNSAVETVVDRIGRERHELSGRAKDLGSAAVFCAILFAGVVWIMILFFS